MGKGPIINDIYYKEFGNFDTTYSFVLLDITFSCSEQYYQYIKCKNNPELQQMILKETCPLKMWRIGQKCILDPNWETIKMNVMREANEHKFNQNPELYKKLSDTQGPIIFNEKHGDYWDTINCQILEKIRTQWAP
jgi:ribA/ribD-fused uncharacterized protein